jgi:hypothetical protein
VLFRWYDSRVLNDLLPVLDREERRPLFGPIATLWTEDPAGELVEHHAPMPGPAIALPIGLFPIRPPVMAALTNRAERVMDQRIAGFCARNCRIGPRRSSRQGCSHGLAGCVDISITFVAAILIPYFPTRSYVLDAAVLLAMCPRARLRIWS